MAVRLWALCAGHGLCQKISLVLISVRGWVILRAVVWLEGLETFKLDIMIFIAFKHLVQRYFNSHCFTIHMYIVQSMWKFPGFDWCWYLSNIILTLLSVLIWIKKWVSLMLCTVAVMLHGVNISCICVCCMNSLYSQLIYRKKNVWFGVHKKWRF
jgi:hypothetical protein